VVDADIGRKANNFNKSKSDSGRFKAKLKPNLRRPTRQGIADC